MPGPRCVDARGRLLGLPFVLAAFVPGCVLGWQACLAALMIASLASFLVYVPLTVLTLNGGGALTEDAPAPALTARAYAVCWCYGRRRHGLARPRRRI